MIGFRFRLTSHGRQAGRRICFSSNSIYTTYMRHFNTSSCSKERKKKLVQTKHTFGPKYNKVCFGSTHYEIYIFAAKRTSVFALWPPVRSMNSAYAQKNVNTFATIKRRRRKRQQATFNAKHIRTFAY